MMIGLSPAFAQVRSPAAVPPPDPIGENGLAPELLPDPPVGGLQVPGVNPNLPQEPGYFGAVTDDRQKLPGVRLIEVVAGGPAEQAGLRAGDLITSVNKQPVREMADLAKIITGSGAGQELSIVFQRGGTLSTAGEEQSLTMVLGRRPGQAGRRFAQFGRIDQDSIPQQGAERPSGVLLGVRTAPLDAIGQRRLGVPVRQGALVLEVVPDSPAEAAGLIRDAVIISLNGQLIDSPDALTREVLQVGPGAEVELGYYLGRDLVKRKMVLGGRDPIEQGQFPPRLNPDQAAAARILQLEQQVQMLQQRLDQLEQRLNAK